MFKLKEALVAAAVVGAFVTLAAMSIHADVSMRMPDPTTSIRIDTLDLMSKAADLPDRTVEGAI
jgi:hypothetical protein